MQQVQILQFSPDEFFQQMVAASERGASLALAAAKLAALPEQQINLENAMALAGFRDANSFRLFCKRNKIQPVAKRAKRLYFLPSQFTKITMPKGTHLR